MFGSLKGWENMAEQTNVSETVVEPTANEITVLIMRMNGLLILVDREGESNMPFSEAIREVIDKFNQPELRSSLSRRLFHPEGYISVPRPSNGPISKNSNTPDSHCPHACCNGGRF